MGHTTLPSNRHIFQTPLFTGGPYQQMVDLICRTQTPPTILEFGQSWGDPGSRGEPHFAWYAPTVFHQNFPIRSKTRLKKPPSKEYFLCAKILLTECQSFNRLASWCVLGSLQHEGKSYIGKPKSTNRNVCP